jgi:hypothetical protein
VCFAHRAEIVEKFLSGVPVGRINSDLTALSADLTLVKELHENTGVALQGPTKGGPFDIDGEVARRWLLGPINPNGRPNSDVLKPWFNGEAITERWLDKWIIDFADMSEAEACLYELPFRHVIEHVRPARMRVARERRKRLWWQYNEPAPGMRAAIAPLNRFIVTPELRHITCSPGCPEVLARTRT